VCFLSIGVSGFLSDLNYGGKSDADGKRGDGCDNAFHGYFRFVLLMIERQFFRLLDYETNRCALSWQQRTYFKTIAPSMSKYRIPRLSHGSLASDLLKWQTLTVEKR